MTAELTLNLAVGRRVVPETLDLEERALIERCQRGDRAAFEPLVRRYMRRAAAFALGWAGNHDDALDLSQEAFARAFRALRRFDLDRPFYPWFHRILRNLCVNHIGRARHTRELPLDDEIPVASGGLSPEEGAARSELQRQVWKAIGRLGEQDREILILREFQEQSYAEIAEILQIPKGTVMSRLHHARRRLKTELEALRPGLVAVTEER